MSTRETQNNSHLLIPLNARGMLSTTALGWPRENHAFDAFVSCAGIFASVLNARVHSASDNLADNFPTINILGGAAC